MKTNKVIDSLVAGTAGLAMSLAAGWASAGTIVGSPHDFSQEGWNPSGEICVVCHTPHNADTSVTAAPLWNHEVTTQTFTLYSSPSFDGAATIQLPTGSSRLCLSCHDGTVAIDSFGGKNGNNFMGGSKAIGLNGNLNDDHPISFTYDSALSTTDPGLHDPATTNVTIGSGGQTKTGTIDSVMLYAGELQCASCHDVHNNFVQSTPLLRITKSGSQLCLTCHNK